jgi:ADP-heptose:LPS heptosyltransferase
MRAVLFKVNQLGDNVAFVPSVQALRRLCPALRLTVVTTPGATELFGGELGAHEVVAYPKRAFDKSYRLPWRFAHLAGSFRRRRPDACLVAFDQGAAAHLVAALSGARIRIGGSVGGARAARWLTESVPVPEDGRPVTWNWAMARALARAAGSGEPWPDAPPPPDLRHLGSPGRRPGHGRPRVVVHAGASGGLNRWPPERFGAVAARLARDFEVVWITHGGTTGTPPPEAEAAPVASLSDLAGWLVDADLFLGNNSGPMHLANALGCPGVAVTGPSAAGWDPYWHRDRWIALRHPDLYCAPCENISTQLSGCANTASPMACLDYWTPRKVEDACRELLGRRRNPSP